MALALVLEWVQNLVLVYGLELALVLEWGLDLVLLSEFVWGVQGELCKRVCCGFLSFHLLMEYAFNPLGEVLQPLLLLLTFSSNSSRRYCTTVLFFPFPVQD
jgi:hypothetical protein